MQAGLPSSSAYLILACLSLVALTYQQGDPDAEYEIVQVTEFVRHGARSSSRNILGFVLPDNIQSGALTANGMRMHYELGIQIRKKYPEIFNRSESLTPADLQIYSSPLPRCIESAISQLMGLIPSTQYPYNLTVESNSKYILPPFGEMVTDWNSAWALPSGYRPFPMIVKSTNIDLFFFSSPTVACPNAANISQIFKRNKSSELRKLWKPISDELVGLGFDPKKLLGMNEFTLSIIASLYDEIKSYKYYYGKLPDKISEDLFERLKRLANIDFSNYFESEKYVRLFTHEVSQEILAGFESASKQNSTKKSPLFRLFSGHDSTLFAFNMAFNQTSHKCLVEKANGTTVTGKCLGLPEFASSWLFELRRQKSSGEYFVKILNDGVPVGGLCSNSSSGSVYCQYSEFIKLFRQELEFKNSSTGDYIDYCGNQWLRAFTGKNPNNSDVPDRFNTENIKLVCLGVTITLLAGILLVLLVNPTIIQHCVKDGKPREGGSAVPEQEESMTGGEVSLEGSKDRQEGLLR
jgi:Histidine phosphatase superfamily (branch 2)